MSGIRHIRGIRYPGNSAYGGASYPAVLEDGNTVKWFDFMENITMNESNLVSSWDNKSGVNGIIPGALLQAGADSIKPAWSANGVLFDGVSDYMKCNAFTLIQPEFIYMVVNQVSWSLNDRLFDGESFLSGGILQDSTTPNISINAGSNVASNSNLNVGSFGIVRALFNGASSKLIVNATTPTTGNAGSDNMGGFTIGARGGTGSYSNIQVKEVIIRKVADGATDEQSIYDYLAGKYSI
jgi:hypothetical protein